MKHSIIVMMFLLILGGCGSSEKEFYTFMESYGNDDYSIFYKSSIYYRGVNSDTSIHVLVFEGCPMGYVIRVNEDKIINIDTAGVFQKCPDWKTDISKINKLVKQYISYPITALELDEDSSLYIGFKPMEFSYVRTNKNIKDNYTLIRDNWYRID